MLTFFPMTDTNLHSIDGKVGTSFQYPSVKPLKVCSIRKTAHTEIQDRYKLLQSINFPPPQPQKENINTQSTTIDFFNQLVQVG